MPRKRLLFISNLYPNPASPHMATFNRQQIEALGRWCDIDVIAPVPWQARLQGQHIPGRRSHGHGDVHHPTYLYTPGCLRAWYGHFFYSSIRKTAEQLLASRCYDMILASWLFPDAWAAARLAQRFDLPLFVKVHGTDVNRLGESGPLTRRSLKVARCAKGVICVSRALKERLVELGCHEEKLAVLYNGVDRSTFRPLPRSEARAKLGVQQDEKIVLYVGNLKREKGLKELLHCVALLSGEDERWRLVIIGAGPFEAGVRAGVAELEIAAKVAMLGTLPLEEIALWMNAATTLCLPSYNEGVPNVVLEALACGVQVVATDVGGVAELKRHEGRLTLVPPRDHLALADALRSTTATAIEPAVAAGVISWEENAERLYRMLTV